MITRELAGDFLMFFYNNGFLLENRVASKIFVRRMFHEFLKENDRTLGAYDEDSTLDEVLNTFNFVCPNIRDEKIYKFDLTELLKYRNELMVELDQNVIQNVNNFISEELKQLQSITEPPKTLADFPNYKLNFSYHIHQPILESFVLSSKGCYCCQLNFKNEEEYMAHNDYHSQESDFEYRRRNLMESLPQQFEVSYNLCEKSHLLITIKPIKDGQDITIEKIITFRSGMCLYLEDDLVPYYWPTGGPKFYLNSSYIFQVSYEQPLLIVYKSKDDPEGFRNVEEHHFLRFDAFPSNISSKTEQVVRRGELKLHGKLPTYPPNHLAETMHLADFDEANHPVKRNIRDFFKKSAPLSDSNICDVFEHLIEMEDCALARFYETLKQSGVTVEASGSDYSAKIKLPSEGESTRSALARGDRITLISKGVLRKGKDSGNSTHNVAKFSGMITNLVEGRVFFESKAGMVATDLIYEVSFEPHRLNIIYQHRALEILRSDIHLRARLFPENIVDNVPASLSLDYFNQSVAESCEQSDAVQNIVQNANKHVPFIIFGASGTGKTTVVVEAILQLWEKSNHKILVMAESNEACDEIASRLCQVFKLIVPDGINVLRLYEPSGKMDNINKDVLEASNLCYGQHFYPSLDTIYTYPIVIATLAVAGRLVHGKIAINHFTHLFIDDCGGCTEPEFLVGLAGILSSSGHLILSGDPKELGPTIECSRAAAYGLERSPLERLMERECYVQHPLTKTYNKTIQARLVHNYRSHQDILELSNDLFYDNALKSLAATEVTNTGIGWCRLRTKTFPIMFESVKGVMRQMKNSNSYCNNEEIKCVMLNVKELMFFGIKGKQIQQKQIGIISPFKLQCQLIRRELDRRGWCNIKTGSIESFQGQEKSIIIASMVLSQVKTSGFSDNYKRLNVLLTRAQALLILVGNSETLTKLGHWKNVIDYCVENNALIGTHSTNNDNNDSNESDSTLAESIQSLSVKDSRRNNNEFKNQKKNTTKNNKSNRNTNNNNKQSNDPKPELTHDEVEKEKWIQWLADLPSVDAVDRSGVEQTTSSPGIYSSKQSHMPHMGRSPVPPGASGGSKAHVHLPRKGNPKNPENKFLSTGNNNNNTKTRAMVYDRNRPYKKEYNQQNPKWESKPNHPAHKHQQVGGKKEYNQQNQKWESKPNHPAHKHQQVGGHNSQNAHTSRNQAPNQNVAMGAVPKFTNRANLKPNQYHGNRPSTNPTNNQQNRNRFVYVRRGNSNNRGEAEPERTDDACVIS